MPRFRVRNVRTDAVITLPSPYGGMLAPGAVAVIEGTEAEIIANLGGNAAVNGILDLETAPAAEALTAHNTAGYSKLLRFDNIPAAAVGVHAAVASNAANAFAGPFTNPTIPRGIQAVFAASYDGGDITIQGTDQFGENISETIVAVAGTTVQGVKAFATVTGAQKATVGATANTVTLQTGTALGVGTRVASTAAMLSLAGVAEAVTINATNNTWVPTSAPNGTRDYDLLVAV